LRAASLPHSSSRGGRTLVTLLGVVVLGLLVVTLVLPALGAGGTASGGTPGRRIVFHVRLGDTVSTLAGRLQAAGVLANGLSAALFQVDARVQGLGSHLRAGTYTLSAGMGPGAAAQALARAPIPLQAASVRVTIPEGLRLEQIAHLLAGKGLVDEGAFLDLARHGQFSNDFLAGRPAGATLEGFLFPNTYDVPVAIGTRGMIQMLLDEFGKEFSLPLRRAAWARGHTLYDVVTMASIVEREAIIPSERPLIAGVYYNRLAGHEGGFFNADPTVQYAVGAATYASPAQTWWTGDLTRADLAVDSPYNTYLHKGLPPGPICSPLCRYVL
jgi:UPF0755 protein